MDRFLRKLLLPLLIVVSCSFSQKLPDEFLHSKIMTGIDLTMKQDYPAAKKTFWEVINKYSDHPAGYVYLAGVLQSEFSDYGRVFEEDLYDSLLTEGELRAEKLIARKETADWGYYFLGTAKGFRGFTESESGNLPGGFVQSIKAANNLERCLELNPKFYAAMDILGSYYYWRSKLSWLPFVSDRREEGIQLVVKSIENSDYDRILGKNNLMLIYTEENRYDDARAMAEMVLQEYPDNRNFLWGLMTIEEKTNNKEGLRSTVERLLHSILSAPVVNYYREATCRVKLAKFALEEKDYALAIDESSKVIALKKYTGMTAGDLKQNIRMAEKISAKAKTKLAKN